MAKLGYAACDCGGASRSKIYSGSRRGADEPATHRGEQVSALTRIYRVADAAGRVEFAKTIDTVLFDGAVALAL